MEGKGKQKAVGTVKRGRTGDLRVVRNSLMCVAGDAIWHHCEVLAYNATRGHVWTPGPISARVIYYQRPGRSPWSRLPTQKYVV